MRPAFMLSRAFATTAEIAAATGWTEKRVCWVLSRLVMRGKVERSVRADGTELWRLTEQQARS